MLFRKLNRTILKILEFWVFDLFFRIFIIQFSGRTRCTPLAFPNLLSNELKREVPNCGLFFMEISENLELMSHEILIELFSKLKGTEWRRGKWHRARAQKLYDNKCALLWNSQHLLCIQLKKTKMNRKKEKKGERVNKHSEESFVRNIFDFLPCH